VLFTLARAKGTGALVAILQSSCLSAWRELERALTRFLRAGLLQTKIFTSAAAAVAKGVVSRLPMGGHTINARAALCARTRPSFMAVAELSRLGLGIVAEFALLLRQSLVDGADRQFGRDRR